MTAPIDDDGYQRYCDELDERAADYPPGWDDPDDPEETTDDDE